jgi:hypothetical protein
MFEVYYLPPSDAAREERIAGVVARHGGRLDFREKPEVHGPHNVCLTYEFAELARAAATAGELQAAGEYVEGPYQYT